MNNERHAEDAPAFEMLRYPAADITAAEFEEYVVETLRSVHKELDNVEVTLHDVLQGVDGSYDMDGTMTFESGGMKFRVLVEAKRHSHPIKRDIVQILHQKILSTGSHKGVIFSTAPFQRGALDYAKIHSIALVVVTEGRYTYVTRSITKPPPLTRELARAMGFPEFTGHIYTANPETGATNVSIASQEYPSYLTKILVSGTQSASAGQLRSTLEEPQTDG
ncbi:restriction endonuclease [Arthrobacter sp. MSA 4-2]|uniref:restriction endonuclease n=1 Tax=Arthrobacter sp. MSA 4-2 TaxID=2794349 RepID=UPI0018E78F91|nr:restriction endonuclease [Arthrobacter sp. MSA 4-2]MBJ2120855.1 restriction endonuclease [Arthrobacter sp. MSA 4-2]